METQSENVTSAWKIDKSSNLVAEAVLTKKSEPLSFKNVWWYYIPI